MRVGIGIALLVALAAFVLGVHALRPRPPEIEAHARRFVILALSLARIDPREIDAYYGPPELDGRKTGPAPSPDALRADLERLHADLAGDAPSPRRDHLIARVDHLIALVGIIKAPRSPRFDDEARRVYGMAPAAQDPAAQRQALAALGALLPGPGSLAARVAAFNNRFVVPDDKRRAVFMRALAECRARTRAHWVLPRDENVTVEWTGDVDAAWHRYQGHDRSLLQINPLAVADPGTALDVACHEAYPGHHAQFVAMTADAGPVGPAVEDTVVILRSPEQVLREGAANYGVDLAFPPQDRLAFERDVLFPLAGFAPRDAAKFAAVHRLVGELSLSVMPILRDYRDRRLPYQDAVAALESQALISSPQALLHFTDALGAYVTGYTVARDLVRDCVAAQGRASGRWAALRAIVAKQDLSVLDAGACGAGLRRNMAAYSASSDTSR